MQFRAGLPAEINRLLGIIALNYLQSFRSISCPFFASLGPHPLLGACITVEPQSTAGKTAVKTAGLVKKIRPERKPTMIFPASQRSYASDAERELACAKTGNSKARLMVINESGNSHNVVSDVAIDCSAYTAPATYTRAVDRVPAKTTPAREYITAGTETQLAGPRTIRVAVDGGPERIYEIDDASGTARPVTQQRGYEPAPQIFEAASRASDYGTQTYRVRRGDTM